MSLLSRIHNRRAIYILFTVLLLVTTTFFSLGLDSTEFKNSLKDQSNEELMERGREYYRHNHMDSALMIFSYISDNYDPELSADEKRLALLAKNNVGIIYAFEYMDFPRGYETLSEAFELADEKGFEDVQVVMCHNIVELLRLYGLCLQFDNVRERIDDYLRLGIEKSLAGKEYKVLASMVINSIQYDMTTSLEPLEAINNTAIPDTIEGIRYARHMLEAAQMFQNDNIPGARALIEASFDERPSYSSPHQYIAGHKRAIARTYAAEGDAETAESIALEALAIADSVDTVDSQFETLAFLAELPVENREKYARQFIDKKDSALTQGQLQMVSEIDFRRSLNREREENRRLSDQRTRLYWGLGLGTLLLILFGILIGLLIRNSRRLRERNASLYAKIQEQLAADTPPTHKAIDDTSKYAGSSLSQEKMDEIRDRLSDLLSDDQWVCDPDISLAHTASRLNVNTTYLSRAVNERFGMSFSSLLNEYRVRIATRRMSKGSPYANQTIESISQSVGYSSRSSFIAAFKKINGMTPSEYMKLSNDLAD